MPIHSQPLTETHEGSNDRGFILVSRSQSHVSDSMTEGEEFNWIEDSDKENQEPPKMRREFTYKERVKVQTLREVGWSLRRISDHTSISTSSVFNICNTPTTPKKRKGRPEVLSEADRQKLVEFVQQSALNRRMTFAEVGIHCGKRSVRGVK